MRPTARRRAHPHFATTSFILGFVLTLAILAVPPAAALCLWLWLRSLHRQAPLPRFARWPTYALSAIAGLITLGTLAAVIHSLLEARTPGLSAAQKQRILASTIAEAFYNGVFGVLLVLIGVLWVGFVKWRTSRRP